MKAEERKKDIRGEFLDNTNLTEDTCQNTLVVHRNTYKFVRIFNEIHCVVKVLECPSIAGHDTFTSFPCRYVEMNVLC